MIVKIWYPLISEIFRRNDSIVIDGLETGVMEGGWRDV